MHFRTFLAFSREIPANRPGDEPGEILASERLQTYHGHHQRSGWRPLESNGLLSSHSRSRAHRRSLHFAPAKNAATTTINHSIVFKEN